MTRRLTLVLLLAVTVVVLCSGVSARQSTTRVDPQAPATADVPPSYDTPPALTKVDGNARLVRQGQSQAAVANMPLLERDQVITESGRVEVTYPDGSLLHVDLNSSVDFLSLDLVRVRDGRVILVTAGRGGEPLAAGYQIDSPAGSVHVDAAGEYRVSAASGTGGVPRVELAVIAGSASLVTETGRITVDAGEQSSATSGSIPSTPETFNSARLDAFDRWSEAQRDAGVATGASAEYLPDDLQSYAGTFDQGGRWEQQEPYGYVWYPQVSAEWRPYYNGYWDNVGPYGWTWIGYDRWAWPTHHFGRWGLRGSAWFWIPGRHWGPAWVSWGLGGDYLGWCPLDFYNRPLFDIFIGNRYSSRGWYGDPWRCWTVVPRHAFGAGFRVAHYAVSSTRLPQVLSASNFARRRSLDASLAAPRNGTGRDIARAAPRALALSQTGSGRAGRSFDTSPRTAGDRLGTQNGTARGPDAAPRVARPGGSANTYRPGASSVPGWTARSYENRPPTAQPRNDQRNGAWTRTAPGVDRPSGAQSRPSFENRPPASGVDRGWSRSSSTTTPRYQAPSRASSAPRYQAPSRAPSSAMPRYQAPSRAPSAAMPRYQAPTSPRYDAPRYQTPSAPRYQAPSAPRYQAPSSAPRYQAPAAPRSQPPAASRPSGAPPSGGGGRSRGSNGRGRGGR